MSSILKDKKIPAVAITSLVLGGSCNGGDGGGVSLSSVAQQMCANFQRCEGEYFANYFDSVAECAVEARQELETEMEYMVEYYGEACAEAQLEISACYHNAYSDCQITEAEAAGCQRFLADLYATCDF